MLTANLSPSAQCGELHRGEPLQAAGTIKEALLEVSLHWICPSQSHSKVVGTVGHDEFMDSDVLSFFWTVRECDPVVLLAASDHSVGFQAMKSMKWHQVLFFWGRKPMRSSPRQGLPL